MHAIVPGSVPTRKPRQSGNCESSPDEQRESHSGTQCMLLRLGHFLEITSHQTLHVVSIIGPPLYNDAPSSLRHQPTTAECRGMQWGQDPTPPLDSTQLEKSRDFTERRLHLLDPRGFDAGENVLDYIQPEEEKHAIYLALTSPSYYDRGGSMPMEIKSKSRRALLATLMVLTTVMIGLQPLMARLGSGCNCGVEASADSSVSTTSCCGNLPAEQSPKSCCSSKQTAAKKCCCNPEASVCRCSDCRCSDKSDSKSSFPVMPTHETTEVVSPTLICAAPFVGYPSESKAQPNAYPNAVAEFAARSSQETCVLLSRFTC